MPGSQGWDNRYMRDGDALVYYRDRKIVKVNNYGIMDSPVLLFGDLTNYVMKKNKIWMWRSSTSPRTL